MKALSFFLDQTELILSVLFGWSLERFFELAIFIAHNDSGGVCGGRIKK